MRKFLLASVLVSLGLMACTPVTQEVGSVGTVSAEALSGGEWKVFEINGQPVATNTNPTIQFDQSRVSGAGSCNRFMGDYTLGANGLNMSFSKMASTMMACMEPAMQQESKYLDALSKVNTARIEAGVLVLQASDGQIIKARR